MRGPRRRLALTASETQETQLVVPREQLAREVRLRVDIRQVMGKKGDPDRGDHTYKSMEGAMCTAPRECPLGTWWLSGPQTGVAQSGAVSADKIRGVFFQGRIPGGHAESRSPKSGKEDAVVSRCDENILGACGRTGISQQGFTAFTLLGLLPALEKLKRLRGHFSHICLH